MNILIVTPGMHEPWVDGRITSLKAMAEGLSDVGFNVEILSTYSEAQSPKTLDIQGIKYSLLPGGNINNWKALLTHFAYICRTGQFDIIIYRPYAGFNWVNNASIISLRFIALLRRIPFILSMWSGPAQFLKHPWFFSAIFTTGNTLQHRKICSIPPIINPTELPIGNPRDVLSTMYGIQNNNSTLLFTYCAKIDTDSVWDYTLIQRGLLDIINAAKHLDEKSKLTFLISMPIFAEKASIDKFHALLDHHKVRKHFTLTSEIRNLPLVLSAIDAYLYPINMDEPSWAPVSALEALSQGTPVITTRIKIIEAFLKEDDALFYEPEHPKELAKTVQFLLENKNEVKKRTAEAKKRVNKRFGCEAVVKIVRDQLQHFNKEV